MSKKKEKPSVVKFNKEAQNNGMTYGQYQQMNSLKLMEKIKVHEGYQKVADRIKKND